MAGFCRAVDCGGPFRETTTKLWEQAETFKDEFLGDLFVGDAKKKITSASVFGREETIKSIGRLLFLCAVHEGSWPQYLFHFMLDIPANYKGVREVSEYVGKLIQTVDESTSEQDFPKHDTELNNWLLDASVQVGRLQIYLLILIKQAETAMTFPLGSVIRSIEYTIPSGLVKGCMVRIFEVTVLCLNSVYIIFIFRRPGRTFSV